MLLAMVGSLCRHYEPAGSVSLNQIGNSVSVSVMRSDTGRIDWRAP